MGGLEGLKMLSSVSELPLDTLESHRRVNRVEERPRKTEVTKTATFINRPRKLGPREESNEKGTSENTET